MIIAEITIYSKKTGKSRTFPLNEEASRILHEWKQNYSFPDRKDTDCIFPSQKYGRDTPMTSAGANKILRKMALKAGIKKDVWMYLFRHTRATRLYEELPTPIVEKLLGHKDMYNTYAHISGKKAREELLKKVYHINEMLPEERADLKKEMERMQKQIEYLQKIAFYVETQKELAEHGEPVSVLREKKK